MLTVLIGTLYPLLLDALQAGSISVGAPYFNQVMAPFVFLLIFFMIVLFVKSQPDRWHYLSGMSLAHTGFIILILGILLSTNLSQEKSVRLRPGLSTQLGPYQFFFLSVDSLVGPNYRAVRGNFDVLKKTQHITYLTPEKRIYSARDMVMTKVDIHPGIFRDLYIVLGEPLTGADWSIRIYYKPFIRWIWLGGILMMLGGLLTLMQKNKLREKLK